MFDFSSSSKAGRRQRSPSVVRMPLRSTFASFLPKLVVLAGFLLVTANSHQASAQCPDPPSKPKCWVECGQCRGDLNGDSFLNEYDRLVFVIFQAQVPQNLCADFNDDCRVDEFDRQILDCIILNSNGLCQNENADYDPDEPPSEDNPQFLSTCGPANLRSCFASGDPDLEDPVGCNDPICCQVVCNNDPLCCDDLWDDGCVNIADNICVPLGPDTSPDAGNCLCEHEFYPPAPDCIVPHNYPGCTDDACTEKVCACEPICCEEIWDELCIKLTQTYCVVPCTNATLVEEVCKLEPACCSFFSVPVDPTDPNCPDTTTELVGVWDSFCADLAKDVVIKQPGLKIRSAPANCLLCEDFLDPRLCWPDPKNPPQEQAACESQAFVERMAEIDPLWAIPGFFNQDVIECKSIVAQNYPNCLDEWTSACAQAANRLCRFPSPTILGMGDCLLPHNGPGCNDAYCTSIVCSCDPICCDPNENWDDLCIDLATVHCLLIPPAAAAIPGNILPGGLSDADGYADCGNPDAGSCLYQNGTPFCNDAACCQIVCGYDAHCCDNRWDELCAKEATAACQTAGKGVCGPAGIPQGYPPPDSKRYRSCFFPVQDDFCQGYPNCALGGCNDASCCNEVCYIDAYCCEVMWDQICADGATVLCPQEFEDCGSPIAGSCFIPHDSPYCDDPICCERVCMIDPACCDPLDTWDEDCVLIAEEACTQCGDVYAGSCLSAHPAPACYNVDCCEVVCEIDPFCCIETWDGSCANIALGSGNICSGFGSCGEPGRSCYLPNYLPGCSDSGCCKTVCEFDSWCCEVRWDAVCTQQAFNLSQVTGSGCSLDANIDGREPCDEFHLTASCNDPACAASVCSIPGYETCCDSRWDTFCVEAAEWVCTGLYECPGPGDCFETHDNPMCEDPACCNVVCTYDPACCNQEWDNDCAVRAISLCNIPDDDSTEDWSCPCEGSCFEARPEGDPQPGCEEQSCCAAICQLNPTCCTVDWDQTCVDLANTYCSGGNQCGTWNVGSCLIPNDTPFCDDPACCQAVCTIDPSCCINTWDSFCVSRAAQRCLRGCGLETAGTCFYPHPTPGCNDAACCEMICEMDEICCTTAWDGTCASIALEKCTPPECGTYAAGNCCELNFSPACNDQRCCDAVCDEDIVCCDTTWDEVCASIARSLPNDCTTCTFDCGDPCAGDCCEPNFTPACNDEDCCSSVCDDDPFCCDDLWDITCASQARNNPECNDPDENETAPCPLPQCGDQAAGSCCLPNGTPSCNNLDCCDAVCTIDPFCCGDDSDGQGTWDSGCVELATERCDICGPPVQCGDDDAGPCCVANGSPNCDDGACCEIVCIFDEICCFAEWDQDCADAAQILCTCGLAYPEKPTTIPWLTKPTLSKPKIKSN